MPICLPDSDELNVFNFEGVPCYVTGWGTIIPKDDLAKNLQEAFMPLVNFEKCHNSYNIPKYGNISLNGGHLCAGPLDGTAGTCVVSIINEFWMVGTRD